MSTPPCRGRCPLGGSGRSYLLKRDRGLCSVRGTGYRYAIGWESERDDCVLVCELLLFEAGPRHRLLGRASLPSNHLVHFGIRCRSRDFLGGRQVAFLRRPGRVCFCLDSDRSAKSRIGSSAPHSLNRSTLMMTTGSDDEAFSAQWSTSVPSVIASPAL